jgi:tetratricopeptide (TPR) repeat protein
MRRSAIVCLLCVTGLLGASPAWARGGARVGAVTEHLLEKGFALLREAERAHFQKDADQARTFGQRAQRVFMDVIAQDPRETRAALLGGQAATFAGDLRSAVRWANMLRRISRLGEDDPDVHYLRAFIFVLGDNQPNRALQELRRMFALNPRARPIERDNLWYLALLNNGRNLLKADEPEDALAMFRSGARVARRLGNPTKEMTMQGNVGAALQRADRWIEATEVFRALAKRQPDSPLWHWQTAIALAGQSKFAEAVPPYREVIRLRAAGQSVPGMDKEMEFVHLRLGNCLRNLSERQREPKKRAALLEEAEQLIRHFVQLRPEVAVGHKWLGVLLYQQRELPYDALPHFHKAFELDPVCVDSLKYIIQIHEHYPPPPDQLPADDPAAAEAARKAWSAPIAAWKKDIEEGAARRKRILDQRERETGIDGCM